MEGRASGSIAWSPLFSVDGEGEGEGAGDGDGEGEGEGEAGRGRGEGHGALALAGDEILEQIACHRRYVGDRRFKSWLIRA